MICEKIKLWEDNEQGFLETYIPKNSEEITTDKKRPTVIICPGGAFLVTTDREAEPVAMRFVAQGYNAIVLRYNTYFGKKVTDRKNPPKCNDKSAYPQPLFDIAKTMLIVRENAENWLVDNDKIVLCGFSAGGNVVANMGVHWDDELLKEKFNVDSELFKPNAIILGYTVADHMAMKKGVSANNEGDKKFAELANKAAFGKEFPSEEELMEASPVNYVTEKVPPTFIWHTADDESVYVANSLGFASTLSKYKVPYELHIFETGVHGLSLCDETTAANENHINPECQQWISLAMNWLRKHNIKL